MAPYEGVVSHNIDHFFENLPYMIIKKELDTISKDIDPTLVVKRLLFLVSVSMCLLFIYHIHTIFFKALLMHELNMVRGVEKLKKEKESHASTQPPKYSNIFSMSSMSKTQLNQKITIRPKQDQRDYNNNACPIFTTGVGGSVSTSKKEDIEGVEK